MRLTALLLALSALLPLPAYGSPPRQAPLPPQCPALKDAETPKPSLVHHVSSCPPDCPCGCQEGGACKCAATPATLTAAPTIYPTAPAFSASTYTPQYRPANRPPYATAYAAPHTPVRGVRAGSLSSPRGWAAYCSGGSCSSGR